MRPVRSQSWSQSVLMNKKIGTGYTDDGEHTKKNFASNSFLPVTSNGMRTTRFSALSVIIFILVSAAPTTLSSLVVADAQAMRTLPALPIEHSAPATAPSAPAPVAQKNTPIHRPVHITIPSIGLDSPIVDVGINKKGEIDVPSGKTNNVGWYKYGVIPGNRGTAILDAHVFAALKNLKEVQPGADIYIETEDGELFHFVVAKKQTYVLAGLTSATLFTGLSDNAMNIITCAGSLTPDRSTYDHRLIVYTTLVND